MTLQQLKEQVDQMLADGVRNDIEIELRIEFNENCDGGVTSAKAVHIWHSPSIFHLQDTVLISGYTS